MTEPLGKPTHFTLHWSAGTYDQTWTEYHFNVKGDGSVVQTLPLAVKGAHCWKRNSQNIGIAFCAMTQGCPVKAIQVEHMAKLIGELCQVLGIDPRGKVVLPKMAQKNGDLVPVDGQIIAPVIADHAYYARQDGYYPDRWDIGPQFSPVHDKALWYYDRLTAGVAKREFTLNLK